MEGSARDIEDYTLDLLCRLIETPSVVGEEEALGEMIVKEIDEIGLSADREAVEGKRFNVITTLEGEDEGPTLLLNGHLDTVPPSEGWSTNPYKPVIKEGRVYGLGAADMKAGLAILLGALKQTVESRERIRGKIIFSAVVDEEAFSRGIERYLKTDHGAEVGLLPEPSGERAVMGAVGKLNYDIEVKGLSAHGSRPELGINAIEDAARIILELRNLPIRRDKRFRGSQCVIKVDGGFRRYSVKVPDRCRVLVNRHIIPGETDEDAVESLKELVRDLKLRSEVDVSRAPPYYPPYTIPTDNVLVETLSEVYMSETGRPLEYTYSEGVSDANILTALGGIPTIYFGPEGVNWHSADEYVKIDSMNRCLRIYAKAIRELLK